jgi:hypothetical protein
MRRRAADQWPARQLAHGQPAGTAREYMPRIGHEHQLLHQEGLHHHPLRRGGRLGRFIGMGQRHVDLARGHGRHPAGRLVLGDGEFHVRMRAAEGAQHGWQQMDPDRRERADPQPAAGQAGEPRQLTARPVHLVQHPAGMLREQLAGRRQPCAAVRAHEEDGPGLPLQLGDLLRERRGRVSEPGGGTGDGTGVRHGDESRQPGRVVHATP